MADELNNQATQAKEFYVEINRRLTQLLNLAEDIARNTSSESARISTIPGRNTIGIELPNTSRENVYLRELLSNSDFSKKEIRLPIALGKAVSDEVFVADLAKMPHLLVAGATGQGKSVGINTILMSLLKELRQKSNGSFSKNSILMQFRVILLIGLNR